MKIPKLECGEGWRILIDPLIERCIAEGAKIVQIKEKLGGLRFYTEVGRPISEGLQDAILEAEARSYEVCEICGQSLHSDIKSPRKPRGLPSTRCLEHSEYYLK